jgi:hypothetical protein
MVRSLVLFLAAVAVLVIILYVSVLASAARTNVYYDCPVGTAGAGVLRPEPSGCP